MAINPDGDQDFNGFISKDVLANIHQEGMVYYVVGPVPMMAHVANLLVELGIPKEHIKYELFGPKEEIFKEVAYA